MTDPSDAPNEAPSAPASPNTAQSAAPSVAQNSESNPRVVQSSRKKRLLALLKLACLAAVIVWFACTTSVSQVVQTLKGLGPVTLGTCFALGLLNMLVASLRWRVLMWGFGAQDMPKKTEVFRVFLVGFFYNTFAPGAIGGDVLRAVLTRKYFDTTAASYLVVGLERLIGLVALALICVAGLVVARELFPPHMLTWALVLSACCVAAVLLLAISGKLKQKLKILNQFPKLEHTWALVAAFFISIVGHAINIAIFRILAIDLGLAQITLPILLVVLPPMFLAAALPISIGGFGPREASLVAALRALSVSENESLALSLSYAACLLALAATGGLCQLLGPRRK